MIDNESVFRHLEIPLKNICIALDLKSQITSTKFQINHNDQNSKFQTLLFWSLVLEIWLLFVIWCLYFGAFIKKQSGSKHKPPYWDSCFPSG
jgi:hypothetical protein